jgi:hypothetical protein
MVWPAIRQTRTASIGWIGMTTLPYQVVATQPAPPDLEDPDQDDARPHAHA